MGFAAPIIFLGLLAAALPLLIHLIGKQRARRVPFAALSFLMRRNRRMRRRLRLRQLLLLLLRIVVVVALVLMIARPYVEVESSLPSSGGAPMDVVLILDDTASMGARVSGESLFSKARERALSLIDGLPPGSLAAVLPGSRVPSPPRLSGDRRALRSAVQRISPTLRGGRLDQALARAEALLRRGAAGRPRHIFILSDGAESSLPARRKRRAEGDPRLHLVDVSPARALPNIAVVRLEAARSETPGHRATRLEARICRYGAGKERAEVMARLLIDGQERARSALSIAPGQCIDKSFDHAFRRAGAHEAVVALSTSGAVLSPSARRTGLGLGAALSPRSADAWPADNRRYLRLSVAAELRVLLLNGDPSPLRHRDELFYLRAALTTSGAGVGSALGPPLHADVLTRGGFGALRPATYDAVVMANVEDLPESAAAALLTFVRGGGGLLIAVGDNVRAGRYEGRLGALLPQRLRSAVSPSPLAGGAALRLGRATQDHPLFAALGAGEGLSQARFSRVFRLRPSTLAGRRQVLLRYDDGSPALVEGRVGAGRVVLMTSTLDRDWGDLAIRPGYLPLMRGLLRYLGGATGRRVAPSRRVGERVALRYPSRARQLRIAVAGGGERGWRRSDVDGEGRVHFEVRRPGFHRLSALGSDGKTRELSRVSFAANLASSESDTRKGRILSAEGAASGSPGGRPARQRKALAHAIGALLLLLLLAEGFITRRG